MTDEQNDYYSMLGLLRLYFDDVETQLLTVLPAFAGERLTFDALYAAIEASAVDASPDITGYAQDRSLARIALLTDVALVGAAGIYYFTHTAPDGEVVNRLKRCLRDVTRQSAADLTVNSRTVWETADGVKALLAPYGISAGDVDALQVKLAKWEDLREAPLDIRATTSATAHRWCRVWLTCACFCGSAWTSFSKCCR